MKTSFAKSIIIFCVFYFSTLKTFSQDTLTYIQTQNIENELGLKNNQEFKVYIMKENYALNIGDTLIIGDPATSTNVNMSVGLTAINSKIYSTIMMGRWRTSLTTNVQFLPEGAKGIKIVVEKIQLKSSTFNRKTTAYGVITAKSVGDENYYTIVTIDNAISTGEIINPSSPMSKDEALTKLKKAKELLDLELIKKEEYENLKQQLSPIILKND